MKQSRLVGIGAVCLEREKKCRKDVKDAWVRDQDGASIVESERAQSDRP